MGKEENSKIDFEIIIKNLYECSAFLTIEFLGKKKFTDIKLKNKSEIKNIWWNKNSWQNPGFRNNVCFIIFTLTTTKWSIASIMCLIFHIFFEV